MIKTSIETNLVAQIEALTAKNAAQAAHRAKLCWTAMLNAAPALQEGK